MKVHLLHPELLSKHFVKETKWAFLQAQASAQLENVYTHTRPYLSYHYIFKGTRKLVPQRGHRCGPTCYLHFYIRGKASVYASSNQVILVKKRTLLGKARSLVVKKEQSFTRTGIPGSCFGCIVSQNISSWTRVLGFSVSFTVNNSK